MKRQYFVGMVLAASIQALVPSYAQVQRSGGGEAQKFMQQYQQVAAEKAALQAQVAQMKKDLDAAKSDLAAMKKERDALKTHIGVPPAALAQATAAKETAEKALEQYKQRMTELVARFRETAANLKDVEADRTKLRTDLDVSKAAFDKCAKDNVELYEINGQILDRLEHVGFFTKASAGEPFTRITRTRIDNLVEEYRARAQALRTKAAAQ